MSKCVCVCVLLTCVVCYWLCSAEAASEHGGAAASRGSVRQEDLHRTSTAHPPAGCTVSHSGTVCMTCDLCPAGGGRRCGLGLRGAGGSALPHPGGGAWWPGSGSRTQGGRGRGGLGAMTHNANKISIANCSISFFYFGFIYLYI